MPTSETSSTALNFTTTMVRANGMLQHFVTAGAGEPVVLLHGFAQTWLEWRRDIIPALAQDYTVIAPDMRGVGDTERPADGYEKRAMAEDIHALLEHLGTGPVLLAGHDFGAAVAYAYAAAHRDAVRKLAIMEMIMPGFGYEQAMQDPFAQRRPWPRGVAPVLPRRSGDRRSAHQRAGAAVPELVPPELRLQPGSHPRRGPGRVRAQLRRARRAPRAATTTGPTSPTPSTTVKTPRPPLTIPVLALGGAGFLGRHRRAGHVRAGLRRPGRDDPRMRPLGRRRAAPVHHRLTAAVLPILTRRHHGDPLRGPYLKPGRPL